MFVIIKRPKLYGSEVQHGTINGKKNQQKSGTYSCHKSEEC